MSQSPITPSSGSNLIDELLSLQDEVIRGLEELDKRLLQTIEEFRASVQSESEQEPSSNSSETEVPEDRQSQAPKRAA